MCGIVCAFDLKQSSEKLRPELLEMSKKIIEFPKAFLDISREVLRSY